MGKYRQGVSALIQNQNQEFLLVNLTSFEHHFFAIPGGGVDEDETQEQAVYREIEEEFGISKNKLELVGKAKEPIRFEFKAGNQIRNGIEYNGQERQFFGFQFIGEASDIHLNQEEVRKIEWIELSNLSKYLLFDDQLETTIKIINEIYEKK